MWFIILILAAIAIGLVVLNYLKNNSIAINTRDGPLSSYKGLSLVKENLVNYYAMMEMNFFQYPVQYIGKNVTMKFARISYVVSKRYIDVVARFKLLFRNTISYKLGILRKTRCRYGPFLGMRFGAIEVGISS